MQNSAPSLSLVKFVNDFNNSINFQQILHLFSETTFCFVYCHQSALSVYSTHVKQAPPTFAS